MKTRSVNKLRNSALKWKQGKLAYWKLVASSKQVRIESAENGVGTRLTCVAAKATAWLEQRVAVRGNKHFRVETSLRCDLAPMDEIGGVVLSVAALDAKGRVIEARATEPLHRASSAVRLRAFYETPKDAAQVRIRVGIDRARGTMGVLEASVVAILDPEWRGHPLAIPPPHRRVDTAISGRIGIVTSDALRPLVNLLRQAVTDCKRDARVEAIVPEAKESELCTRDALLFVDDRPPRALRNIGGLLKLAEDRVVMISLAAFAAMSRGALRVRTVEQADDPMYAYITSDDRATRGFALHDAFPFAWSGSAGIPFVQRQFTRTAGLKRFCERHGLAPLLKSLCDTDANSERVIALVKPSGRGGLYVLDLLALECEPSSLFEPVPLMTMLLNILGHGASGLGQYVVPESREEDSRSQIREMPMRFAGCRIHEKDVPAGEVRDQILTFESEGADQRPLIVVRTGLTGGDQESVYAAWAYFKQLVRMSPHICPYADTLLSQVTLAWQPLCAPWEPAGGWRRTGSAARTESIAGMEAFLLARREKLAAFIDIEARPIERSRVIAADLRHQGRRVVPWLPRLWESFGPESAFTFAPAPGEGRLDRDSFTWRLSRIEVEIDEDVTSFNDGVHRSARQGGAALWRLEIPGGDADFVARSIERTNLGATLLEHMIGLTCGMTAVNRRGHAVEFPPFAPIAPGEALIVPERDPVLERMAEPA